MVILKRMQQWEQMRWWNYSGEMVRDLMGQSLTLLHRFEVEDGGANYHDYSFIVFPAAKAYEGFLKKLFWEMGLITKQQYFGEHFRIGRALSPTLPKRYRHGWVFDKLIRSCEGEALPNKMWETWKRARNKIFHFFPDHNDFVSLSEARSLVEEIMTTMEEALVGCKVE